MKFLVLFGLIAATWAAPVAEAEAEAEADPGQVVVAHHAALSPLQYNAGHFAHAGTAPLHYAAGQFAPAALAPVAYAHRAAVAPVAYAQHAAVAPVAYAQHAAVAPVAYAQHAAVAPVAYAAPAPVPVALPPAEVQIPVTSHHVEIPVKQQVHYGTQSYVAGATTTIHKPSLAAPAIAPPSTLLSKVHHNPAEVTLKTQEIPVDRHTPNFVDTPFHAGTIVKYTAPEIREVKVPTPVAQPFPVGQPVPYAAPYAVPQAVPVPQEYHSIAVHQPINYVQHAFPTVVKANH